MILIFGSVNVDLVSRVERIARPGETVLAPGYERFFGGKGANQAVAAARASGSEGPPVLFCGAIGADGFGRDCAANLVSEGIDVSHLQSVDAGTGCAFISVDSTGENAITVASGANSHLKAARLDDASLDGVRVAVMQMEVSWRENAALAERLRSRDASIVLNYAPAQTGIPPAELRSLLRSVDHLVVNEHEAETLADILGLGMSGDAGRALADGLSLRVIVTLGGEGVKLLEPMEPEWRQPAIPVDVVDTTGAGDTFVGVLAAGLAEELSVREAIGRAGLAASLSCTKAGAQGGMPRRAELPGPERVRHETPIP